jgi:alkanesulfonate monooxygenase SsuD/methylene tetrahydromethanopterin reductase-like flavin-dependent oxidoreductase (luciferase family)
MSRVPLAVLDLSPISEGSTARQALQNTKDLAQNAESWGCRRYWVAEHHFVALASSSPAVLIGLIAAATKQIRVGSAAVQIGPSHRGGGGGGVRHHRHVVSGPYRPRARPVRATTSRGGDRQGRTGGTEGADSRRRDTISQALPIDPLILSERFAAAGSVLQQPGVQVPDFDDQLDDVIALLGGKFETDNGVHLSATPGEAAAVELWLFGSSGGQSARAAGVLGLPFVANYHVIPAPPSTPLRPTGRRSRRPRFSTSPTSWCPRMCLWRKQIRKRSIWLHRFRAGFTASAAGTAPFPTQIPRRSKRWRPSTPHWSRTESPRGSWERPPRSRRNSTDSSAPLAQKNFSSPRSRTTTRTDCDHTSYWPRNGALVDRRRVGRFQCSCAAVDDAGITAG